MQQSFSQDSSLKIEGRDREQIKTKIQLSVDKQEQINLSRGFLWWISENTSGKLFGKGGGGKRTIWGSFMSSYQHQSEFLFHVPPPAYCPQDVQTAAEGKKDRYGLCECCHSKSKDSFSGVLLGFFCPDYTVITAPYRMCKWGSVSQTTQWKNKRM